MLRQYLVYNRHKCWLLLLIWSLSQWCMTHTVKNTCFENKSSLINLLVLPLICSLVWAWSLSLSSLGWQVAQLSLTLCGPMDCSLPGSSTHGIFQARILEWAAISFSRGSSRPTHGTHVSYVSFIGRRILHHWCHLGSPLNYHRALLRGQKKILHEKPFLAHSNHQVF